MKTNVEFKKEFDDAAVLLRKFPHLRPRRVVVAFERQLDADYSVDECANLFNCYDEQSQDRLLEWFSRGGEIDFIRQWTAERYSFTRMIGEAESAQCLAIGFPKKRDRGFVVIEEPDLNTDGVWDLLSRLRASLRERGMNKQHLSRCLIEAPCLILVESA